MSDAPELMVIPGSDEDARFAGYPRRLELLPNGVTLPDLGAVRHAIAVP